MKSGDGCIAMSPTKPAGREGDKVPIVEPRVTEGRKEVVCITPAVAVREEED